MPRNHHCHAYMREVRVPPSMHMCPAHWRMVPKPLQRALWSNYRKGQENDMRPSAAYLRAAADCVWSVGEQEGHDPHELAGACAAYKAWADML